MKHSKNLQTNRVNSLLSLGRLLCGVSVLLSFNLIAQPSESVVTVFAQKRDGASQGTGFVFGTGGRIATAYHVVQGAASIELFDKAFSKMTKVRVDRIDPKRDIAILIAEEAMDIPVLKLATTTPSPQEKIFVAGTPRGMPKQVLHGRITSAGYVSSIGISSAQGRPLFAERIDVLPVDVTVYGGMSGAPVLNERGDVTGILSGSLDEGRGIGWAIPSKYIVDLMNASALNKSAGDLGLWPDLSLMNRTWTSLSRSYAKKISSEEMAEIEALSVAFQTLKGVWQGSISNSKSVTVPDKGTCAILTGELRTVSFAEVDQDRRVIRGVSRSRATTRGFEFRGSGDGSWCTSLDRKNVVLVQAEIEIDIEDIENFSQDDPVFNSIERVKECQVNDENCTASYFGKKERGDLEVISASKIRWRKGILEKK